MADIGLRDIERTYALILDAAVRGDRCPSNHPYGPLHAAAVRVLVQRGDIVVHLSSKNYRQVFILTGLCKGRSTAPDPFGRPVYKIVSQFGSIDLRADQKEAACP